MSQDNNNTTKSSVCDERGFSTRKLYGRRQGRALKNDRARVIKDILPNITIPTTLRQEQQKTPPHACFDTQCSEYWLEIGFGHGEHLTALTQQNPHIGYIGAEPFINGMASFLMDIEHNNHNNIRVSMDDGMIIARSIKPASLDGIYILNPDPWHKKRHHKRRIINQGNLDVFAKILKPGAQLVMTTDVPYLAEWMCTQTSNHPAFEWSAESQSDWNDKPKEWITTRYEEKGAKGAKKMVYLFYKRV